MPAEIATLRWRNRKLIATVRLLVAFLRTVGIRLDRRWLPEGKGRTRLLREDVTFSNSMIEAWWRTLKHQWLFLNTLDSVGTVRRLVAFYVEAHNTQIPHAAFRGQTPDEIYSGRSREIPDQLEAAKRRARAARLKANREISCELCQPGEERIADTRAVA